MKSDKAIEAQILAYWRDNPAAQDTLEGIAAWWILHQTIAPTAARVELALASLVEQKKVGKLTGADGRVRYSHLPENSGPADD